MCRGYVDCSVIVVFYGFYVMFENSILAYLRLTRLTLSCSSPQVSMVLPNTTAIPEQIRNCLLQDTDYYRIFSLKLHHLIDKEFIEAFVKKGMFIPLNNVFYNFFFFLILHKNFNLLTFLYLINQFIFNFFFFLYIYDQNKLVQHIYMHSYYV